MKTSFPHLLAALAAFLLALIRPACLLAVSPVSPGVVVSWGSQSIPLSFYDGQSILQVAGGYFHSLALKNDGTVVAWGDTGYGETSVPVGLGNVMQIAAGAYHSLALKNDGTVVAWGSNSNGQTSVPGGLSTVVQIAGGNSHSLALKSNGTVVAWGDNSSGQRNVPAGLSNAVQIAGGYSHSLVRKSDGTVVAWGSNSNGQTSVPAGLGNVIQIAAGGFHSLALKSDGTVVAWGYNSSGQSTVPAGLGNVVRIAAGTFRSLALKSDGTVVAWGSNSSGESTVPTGLGNVVQIAGGSYHTLALKTDGTMVTWGDNSSSQCCVPASLSTVVQIAAGFEHSLALKSDGTVIASGQNSYGESSVPSGLATIVQIAAGSSHSLALKSNGTVVAWGDNSYGQISIPASLGNVVQVAGGYFHCLARKSDGTVVGWGSNSHGQTNVPAGLGNVVQIAGGGFHSLALRNDGTVAAWGNNAIGQSSVPAGLGNVVQIAAGTYHSLALKSDGTVVAWGQNSYGQIIVPAGLSNVVQIAGGSYHSLALKGDGTVVAWGQNSYSQTSVPAGLSNVMQIAAGASHSLAIVRIGPTISSVTPNPVAGSNSPQTFTVNGVRFDPNCTVTLRNLTTGEAFPNFQKTAQTANSITVNPIFGILPRNWSVEVINPGVISSGQYAFQVIAPVPPTVTTQPEGQTITSGGNVTFSVSANGIPSPTFQWRLNGANIAGATSPTLTVSNAQLANAGNYTVVASNSAGQVTSTAAKLTVLSNLDSVLVPIQPVYSAVPARGVPDSLVVVTHGWEPVGIFADISWVTGMADSIRQQLANTGRTNWLVVPWDWVGSASTPFPDLALGNAHNVGRNLGKQIVNAGWSHVHFVAHSAGAALIQSATDYIKQNSSITVHETFLDPYLGMHRAGTHEYGHLADWADNYFSHDTLTGGEVFSLTEGPLDYAYNVEVTWLDPTRTVTPQYSSSLSSTPSIPSGYGASSTHGWPYEFYQDTIPPIPLNRLPGYEGFGFPLSKEGGGWSNRGSFTPNNPAHVLAAPSGTPQGSIPVTTGSSYNFSILAHPTGQTGLVQFNTSGFTAATGNTPFSPQLIGKDGFIQTNAAAAGAPAWTSIPVDVTSSVNFVTFNAQFTSTAGAMGLLTVYWNDVEIGKIDERDVLAGMQTYTFGVTGTFLDRSNSLGFRIDQFSTVPSSVSVTNVATGFGGLTNAPKLKIQNISGISTPVLTLTGAVNYTYLVETSQDLVNWEPMAAVTLDTGVTAALIDPTAAGLLMRFYRGVSP